MTREEAKKLLPIIQAYVEGKNIQYECDIDCWEDTENPSFRRFIKYRIKPKPKYRPFKTQEECWNEMLKHQPFGWIMNKSADYICLSSMNKHFEEKDFSYMFRAYTFADGTLFGVKIENI